MRRFVATMKKKKRYPTQTETRPALRAFRVKTATGKENMFGHEKGSFKKKLNQGFESQVYTN